MSEESATDRLFGPHSHLRRIVTEYVIYFNEARPHQGIGQRIPCEPPLPDPPEGEILSFPVLGGLYHDYRRQAA